MYVCVSCSWMVLPVSGGQWHHRTTTAGPNCPPLSSAHHTSTLAWQRLTPGHYMLTETRLRLETGWGTLLNPSSGREGVLHAVQVGFGVILCSSTVLKYLVNFQCGVWDELWDCRLISQVPPPHSFCWLVGWSPCPLSTPIGCWGDHPTGSHPSHRRQRSTEETLHCKNNRFYFFQ